MIPRQFIYILAVAFLLLQCQRTDADREANRIFVEAYQLVENAQQIEHHDPAEAYDYYRRALEKIENIIDNYPATQVAVDLAQYRTRIGEITVGDLRGKVPRYAARVKALENFHQLALYLIDMEDEDLERERKRLEYARQLYSEGASDQHDDLIRQIAATTHRHWNRVLADKLYHDLSSHLADISRWEQGMELVDRIQSPDILFEAAKRMITSGVISEGPPRFQGQLTGYLQYLGPIQQVRLLEMICSELFASGNRSQAVALARRGLPTPDDGGLLGYIEALTDFSTLFARKGEFEISRTIIMQIRNLDYNYADFALRDLAAQIAIYDDLDAAMGILESFDREYFRHTAMVAIANKFIKNNQIEKALDILDIIPDEITEKSGSLLEIAGILSKENEQGRSDSLLHLALPGIDKAESALIRSQLQISVARIYLQKNQRSLAAEALERAESDCRNVSGSENLNLLISRIIKEWISLGRPDRALDLAVWFRMDDPSFDDLVPELFSHAITRGFHDFARSLAGISQDQSYFLYILTGIYLDNGVVSQPSELAYDIRDLYWRSRALARLVQTLKNKVNVAAADKAATDSILTIQRIRGVNERRLALYHTACRLSAAEMTMNSERRALAVELLRVFDM